MKIAIYIYPGMTMLDAIGPYEVLILDCLVDQRGGLVDSQKMSMAG